MKKTYIIPQINVVAVGPTEVIMNSITNPKLPVEETDEQGGNDGQGGLFLME